MHGAQAMPSQPQAERRCFRDEDLPTCNVTPKLQASLTFCPCLCLWEPYQLFPTSQATASFHAPL